MGVAVGVAVLGWGVGAGGASPQAAHGAAAPHADRNRQTYAFDDPDACGFACVNNRGRLAIAVSVLAQPTGRSDRLPESAWRLASSRLHRQHDDGRELDVRIDERQPAYDDVPG